MPKIVVKRKSQSYKEFLIRPSQNQITIGSEGDNDLIISDKDVLSYHCVIKKERSQYFIEVLDNNSSLILNGKKIDKKTKIINSDEIIIGEHSLVFHNELFEEKVQNNENFEKPNNILELKPDQRTESFKNEEKNDHNQELLKNDSEQKEITKNDPEKKERKNKKLIPHILIAIHGPYLGKVFPLKFGDTKIGRDRTLNDIIIRETKSGEIDSSISRRHAKIIFEGGYFYISDKRSKTRTWVNQKQLDENDLIQLSPNDEIHIVSDQQSTIFRFLETGKENFSRPQKAGFWWDRNANKIGKFLSFGLAAILFYLIIFSLNNIKLLNQNPDVLKLKERILFSGRNEQTISLNKEEVLKNASMLSPSVADLNGDKFLDIIYLDKIGYLHVINGKTYQSLWKNDFPHRAQISTGITIADMNGNNLPDILIISHNSITYAIDGNSGNEIWASPILGGKFSGNPVVADLNGDKFADIFLCNQSGGLHIGFGGFNNPEWTNLKIDTKILCPPSAADLNNDDLPEVFFGSEQGHVFIYNGTKRQITTTINVNEELQKAKESFSENHHIQQRIAAGKLNDDPFNDIVILTKDNHILAFDVFNNKRIWYDKLKTDQDSGTTVPPTIGDLTGDKKMEVVVVTRDNKIVVYNGMGKGAGLRKIIWGYLPANNEHFVSPPVLADINKDYKNDVIVANYNGNFNIFNGSNGKLLNKLIPALSDSLAAISTPIIADLDKNGSLDILLRKNDDSFYSFETNSLVKQGAIFWGQFNFNALQNGRQLTYKNIKLLFYSILSISNVCLILVFLLNIQIILKRRRFIKERAQL